MRIFAHYSTAANLGVRVGGFIGFPVIFLPWYVPNYNEEEDHQEDSVAADTEEEALLKDFKQDLIQNQKKLQ